MLTLSFDKNCRLETVRRSERSVDHNMNKRLYLVLGYCFRAKLSIRDYYNFKKLPIQKSSNSTPKRQILQLEYSENRKLDYENWEKSSGLRNR